MKFRYDNNRQILRDLFVETAHQEGFAIYTLGRVDTDLPSLYLLYMAEEDFTEFVFANKYFESYQHWKTITNSPWMAAYIAEWREELELMIKARNLKSLINKAEEDSNVAKYLLGNKWIDEAQKHNRGTNLRGRPSKEDIRQHLYLITKDKEEAKKDLQRINN